MMVRDELRTLTSLRGLAAVLVAAFHVPQLFGVRSLAPHAYLAVDFFFTLSGFVLTHAYGARIEDGGMSLTSFTKARLARLYPLYALATLIGAALLAARVLAHTVAVDSHSLMALPLTLAFLPAPPSLDNPAGAIYPFDVQGWSLLWELVVAFALFAWLRLRLRGLEIVVSLAMAVLVAVCWNRSTLDGGWRTGDMGVGAARAVFGFAAGAYVRRKIDVLAVHRALLGWAALVSGLLAAGYIILKPEPVLEVELAFAVLGFPILVAGAALTTRQWLTGGLFEATGHASYSIYLLHGPLGIATGMVLSHTHHLTAGLLHLFGPAWLVGLIGLSWMSWRHVEEPARRALMKSRLRHPATPGSWRVNRSAAKTSVAMMARNQV